jgi:hypothetical protein
VHFIDSRSTIDCSSYMLSPRCIRWCLAWGSKSNEISMIVERVMEELVCWDGCS